MNSQLTNLFPFDMRERNQDTSTLTTTSLAIAEGVGIEHEAIIRLVRDKLEKLQRVGQVCFKNTLGTALPQGGRTMGTKYAILTEPQATLLLAFMRNRPIVKDFKVHLVEVSYRMREELRHGSSYQQELTQMDKLEAMKLYIVSEEKARGQALLIQQQKEELEESEEYKEFVKKVEAEDDYLAMKSTQTPLVKSMTSAIAVLYLAIELGVEKWLMCYRW